MAAEVEYQMLQLVNLAIGTPEIGAVNFNLLQRVLSELLKLTDLDSVTVKLSAAEAAKIGETQPAKPAELEGGTSQEARGSKRGIGCGMTPEKADELVKDVNQLKMDVEDLKAKHETAAGAAETVPFQEMRASVTKIDSLQGKVKDIEGMMQQLRDLDLGDQDMPLGQRLKQMQKLVDLHEDELTKINSTLEEKLEYMDKQIKDLESNLGEVNEKVTLTKLGGGRKHSTLVSDAMKDSKMSLATVQDQTANINNLISRLSSVQHDLDNLTMMTNNMNEESERKQMLIDALTEQIEMLKMAKADKTNMEDILAAKADISQVHRKVSHDHFENKIEQLNTALEDAFGRLDTHEESWQEEVEELRTDIQNKLDKMEFNPLKDYVNEKLKMLQDKMKALAAQKREGMAAGSKRRILRDVQCISCDNESVMRPDNTFDEMMPPPPLPTQPSVRPYLAYKLDQVRKQQKKLPGRNLLHFEEMLQNPGDPKLKSRSGEHLVNRFVGGSHTTTTPQQRITRTGNFFETWGPVITAVHTGQQPSDVDPRQPTVMSQAGNGNRPATVVSQAGNGNRPATVMSHADNGNRPATVISQAGNGNRPATVMQQATNGNRQVTVMPNADNGNRAATVMSQTDSVNRPATVMSQTDKGNRPATVMSHADNGNRPATVMSHADDGNRPATVVSQTDSINRPATVVSQADKGNRPATVVSRTSNSNRPATVAPQADNSSRHGSVASQVENKSRQASVVSQGQ